MEDLKVSIVQDTSCKITTEQLCRCITGFDIKTLAQAIAANVGGQYDSLYKSN